MARRIPLFLCCVLVVAMLPTLARSADSVFLEDLTWTELRDRIHSGSTTIIVPIGGTEQNGPYMALGKHNVRVKVLSERIAAALGNAIVAPVLAYVPEGGIAPPTAHMRFAGTITIPDDVFRAVLESAARGFRLHGFKDVVFLGDHGGYQASERAVADRLNREWNGTDVRVHAVEEYYRVTQTSYLQALKSRGFTDEEIGTHAGLSDTPLMLATDSDLVRLVRLQGGAKPGAADGVYGDPRRSSADLGQLGVDAIVNTTVAAIRKAVSRQAPP